MSDRSVQRPRFPDNKGIAIVACSSAAIDDQVVARGIENLSQLGFQVHNYYQPENKYLRFGASDVERVAQLHAAANNPDVAFIMALRGGYGLSRLLPLLDFQLLAGSGKLFIGHSDFTVLQMALLAHSQTQSLAGPMLCDDFTSDTLNEKTITQFVAALGSEDCCVDFSCEGNPEVEASGTLWGGNLAMLAHLVGSDYFPTVNNGILFLEDIAEHPFRVERMLLQLHFSGILNKQKAIILGDFSGYRLAPHDNGYDFNAMLQYLRSIVTVPILTGLPFGHIKEKTSLMIGAQAALTSKNSHAKLIIYS